MTPINIQFTRFSAFYSPLISTMSGGFLAAEGLEPTHSISAPGVSAIDALLDGSAHVVQSALSQGLTTLEKGETPKTFHFAQINEMDGFFLTGRAVEPDFAWDNLIGKKVLVDHGGQPLAMFKYACHKAGINYDDIDAVDAGNGAKMDAAFRAGQGDYIHQQGPSPQQLEHDGVGHVVASVGEQIGPCGFSSLASTPEWLASDMAKAFMRAYRKTRAYILETPAAEIAAAEAPYFPNIDQTVLTTTIAFYQGLGNWSPHVEITKAAYEVTLDVFEHVGRLTKRHAYEDVCMPPPAED
ncbi:MAG: ABC transporter substrate-binding protein [Proteobacteria bacterium]|nr:ABC transporter substrate-binding protein [Pseudomonadota bacterium]